MPLELIVHAPGCATKRRAEGCSCEPQVFEATEADRAREAHGGDVSRLELGRWRPPVHMDTLPVANSQSRRHRAISE